MFNLIIAMNQLTVVKSWFKKRFKKTIANAMLHNDFRNT